MELLVSIFTLDIFLTLYNAAIVLPLNLYTYYMFSFFINFES